MRTGSKRFRTAPLAAAAAAVAFALTAAVPSRGTVPPAARQTAADQASCPAVVSVTSLLSCVLGPWNAIFSAGSQDTVATPSGAPDTVHVAQGSLYLTTSISLAPGVVITLPVLPGSVVSPLPPCRSSRRVGCDAHRRVSQARGPVRIVLDGEPQDSILLMGFAPDSAIVALVSGTLPSAPNLAVGCQTKYWQSGTSVDSATTPFGATVTASLGSLGVALPPAPSTC